MPSTRGRSPRKGGGMTTTTWSIRELPELETTSSAGSWLLHGFVQATNEVLFDSWGTHDYDRDAREILGSLHDQKYVRKIRLVAVDDTSDAEDPARVLAVAALNLSLQDNTHLAVLEVSVRPSQRRRGIGSSLHDAAIALARDAGRTRVQVSVDQRVEPPEGPDTLRPTTGEGRVLRTDPSTQFALKR